MIRKLPKQKKWVRLQTARQKKAGITVWDFKKTNGKPEKRLLLSPYDYSAKNKWQVLIHNFKIKKLDTMFFRTRKEAVNFVRMIK